MFFYEGWYLPDGEKHFKEALTSVKHTHQRKQYQKEHRDLSLSHVTSFNTAIDIGACVGFWSRDLCKRFDKVICFEPYPESAACLKQNLKLFNNFKIEPVALSNETGLSKLYVSKSGIGGNSISHKSEMWPAINVKTKKLDDYHFDNIDYIKMDVQFFELSVLQGADNTLKENDPVVCIECARRDQEELEYVTKIVDFMSELGYSIVGMHMKEIFFKKA